MFILKFILKKYYNSIIIKFLLPEYVGYADFNRAYKFDFFSRKIDKILELPSVSLNKVDLSKLYSKESNENSNQVAFSIKDENYNKILEITSLYCSDTNMCTKSLDFLINNNFKINRIGENLMNKINYENENFKDFCYHHNHNDLFDEKIANSSFYFGSSSSMGTAPELFNKKKIIINEIDHTHLSYSRSYDNVILFKKFYCYRTNKLIKIEDLFKRNLYTMWKVRDSLKNNEIYLEENTKEEIFESIVEFYEINFKNKKRDDLLIKKYLEMRNHYLNIHSKSDGKNLRPYSSYEIISKYYCTISESFLKKNL